MSVQDKVVASGLVFLVCLFTFIAIHAFETQDECNKSGGEYVKTLSGYKCIKMKTN